MNNHTLIKTGAKVIYRSSVEDANLSGAFGYPKGSANTTSRDPVFAWAATAMVAAFATTVAPNQIATNYKLPDRSTNDAGNEKISSGGPTLSTMWPAVNRSLAQPAYGDVGRSMLHLRSEMQAQFAALNGRIDRLSSSPDERVSAALEIGSLDEQISVAEIEHYMIAGDLRSAFNAAADTGIGGEDIVELAKKGLADSSAQVRSSAARALATLAPIYASTTLPVIIASETNKISRKIMVSALRAAII